MNFVIMNIIDYEYYDYDHGISEKAGWMWRITRLIVVSLLPI